jgi:hypothetical protein
MLNGAVNITQAKFNIMQGGSAQSSVDIQFNPASLQYTIENTLGEPSKDGVKRQYVTQSSGKLTMDLFYDTTDSGADVRSKTEQVAKLMEPVPAGDGKGNVPPTVQFEWGTYKFTGMMQSYKETIDFFSANGVPLRASINLTIASQTDVFSETDPSKPQSAQVAPTSRFDSAASVAQRGGDPSAARALASANGLDSLRFTNGASLAVSGSINLQGPVAFASASASAGIGGGGGIGVSGGAGIGAGVGAGGSVGISGGAGASAGAGLGVSGGLSASISSAGVAATAGAFSGLRTSSSLSSQSLPALDVSRIRSQAALTPGSTAAGVSFGIGGVALQQSSPGLSANVGANRSLASVLQFGE